MKEVTDFRGTRVRITDERLAHITEHPEMAGMESAIEETLSKPELVIQSRSDPSTEMYYRMYYGTRVGDKHLCVVVKVLPTDAFVLTAYLTDKPKKGEILWGKKS